MSQESKNTTEEIEILKAALETLLKHRNYNFLDPLVLTPIFCTKTFP